MYGGVDFGVAEREAIQHVLDRNWWGLAEEGDAFEKELAATAGVNHAIFVSSGSAALELGIVGSNLPRGSEVIVPACTFPTPVASLIRAELVPVIADIQEGTNFLDPDSLLRSLTPTTRAVLLVYVAGNVGRLDDVLAIAREHNLLVFEDNCDGFGGNWRGKLLGSFGCFSAISTHAAHIISTGQGGVVFTNDLNLAQTVRQLRDWGRDTAYASDVQIDAAMPREYHRYTYTNRGYNFQPLELQAAMGRVQLKRLEEFKACRKSNFEVLYTRFQRFSDRVTLPRVTKNSDPCWYTFPFVVGEDISRSMLTECLDRANIDWRPILAGNIARQPAFREHVVIRDRLKEADKIFERGLWLPVHPTHSSDAMHYIADVVEDFLAGINLS